MKCFLFNFSDAVIAIAVSATPTLPSLAALGFLSVCSIGACEAFSIGSSDSSLTACLGEELGYFSAFSVQD